MEGQNNMVELGYLLEEAASLRLRNSLPALRQAEKKVALYILKNPKDVTSMSVSQLADQCGVSEATVVRVCQRSGFDGFQDLKIQLARETPFSLSQLIHEEVKESDDVSSLKQKIFHSSIRVLSDTANILDNVQLEKAIDVLANAKRIEVYGIGGSGPIVHDAFHKFLKIGIKIMALSDSHLQAMSAILLHPGDAVIGISHTGASRDVVEAVKKAKEAGAITIAISRSAPSPLSRIADINLPIASSEGSFSNTMGARLATLAVIDCLFVGIAMRQYDKASLMMEKTREATAGKRF